MSLKSARATSFATLKDLEGYIRCLQSGKSSDTCYDYGDNGRGAWGDLTAQIRKPMVAIPTLEMRKKWGNPNVARGKFIKLTIGDKTHRVEVRDKGPSGVVDLNPAALILFGYPIDMELNVPCKWDWDEASAVASAMSAPVEEEPVEASRDARPKKIKSRFKRKD
jgi:hypothetical protein